MNPREQLLQSPASRLSHTKATSSSHPNLTGTSPHPGLSHSRSETLVPELLLAQTSVGPMYSRFVCTYRFCQALPQGHMSRQSFCSSWKLPRQPKASMLSCSTHTHTRGKVAAEFARNSQVPGPTCCAHCSHIAHRGTYHLVHPGAA